MQRALYVYEGPVLYFDTVIRSRWRGQTYAVSEKQAKSNLRYQALKEIGYAPDVRVTLPGKVRLQHNYI